MRPAPVPVCRSDCWLELVSDDRCIMLAVVADFTACTTLLYRSLLDAAFSSPPRVSEPPGVERRDDEAADVEAELSDAMSRRSADVLERERRCDGDSLGIGASAAAGSLIPAATSLAVPIALEMLVETALVLVASVGDAADVAVTRAESLTEIVAAEIDCAAVSVDCLALPGRFLPAAPGLGRMRALKLPPPSPNSMDLRTEAAASAGRKFESKAEACDEMLFDAASSDDKAKAAAVDAEVEGDDDAGRAGVAVVGR